jgi:hypothetical protein
MCLLKFRFSVLPKLCSEICTRIWNRIYKTGPNKQNLHFVMTMFWNIDYGFYCHEILTLEFFIQKCPWARWFTDFTLFWKLLRIRKDIFDKWKRFLYIFVETCTINLYVSWKKTIFMKNWKQIKKTPKRPGKSWTS